MTIALGQTSADLLMIFGPSLAFLPQYLQIKESKNASGYSSTISLILVSANVVRLFFWLYKRFSNVLLYQSIVTIVAQLTLMELVTRVNRQLKRPEVNRKPITLTGFDWRFFLGLGRHRVFYPSNGFFCCIRGIGVFVVF
eukprot:Rmarinus@m.7461